MMLVCSASDKVKEVQITFVKLQNANEEPSLYAQTIRFPVFFHKGGSRFMKEKNHLFSCNWNSFPFSNLQSSYAGDPVLAWLWYFQAGSARQQPFSGADLSLL